jgi:hypothetical protein
MNLFNGEQLVLELDLLNSLTETADDKINEKYVKGEIRIVTEQARYPLNTIASILETSKYKLNPEYQRRHRWSTVQKSRLIESLIMNVPVPAVFLYEYEFSQYEVMDGLQRLTAINEFYKNKFALEGLEKWTELNTRTYSTLPEKVREGIDRRYLSSVILLKETAKNNEEATELKKMVFERLNSGGVKLEPQESRNAIFDGPLNQLCLKLSKNSSLCRLWQIPEPSAEELAGEGPSEERLKDENFRRMEDVELVLRFFAYRQKAQLHKSTVPLATYLDKYLQFGNFLPTEVLLGLENLFNETIALVEEIFGDKAFWMYRERKTKQGSNWFWRSSPSVVIFDPLMAVISHHLNQAQILINNKDKILSGLEEFYTKHYDNFAGRNVNPSALLERERLIEEYISSYLQ